MMNKKTVFLLAFVFSFVALAQNESEAQYKAVPGEKTLELQFVPFGSTPVSINGIRYRKFSSEAKAFRLNAFLGIDTDTDIIQQEIDDIDQPELKFVSSEIALSIRPGFENHIAVSERLSPYFGMEFEFALQRFSAKEELEDAGTVVYLKQLNSSRSGFIRLGANAIAGLDYYVAKKLYLGTEFGFGLSYTGYLAAKVKSDITGFTEPDPVRQGSSFDLGPNVIAQIRLGYAF